MKYKRRYSEEIDVVQWTVDNLNEMKEFLEDKFVSIDEDNNLWYKHSQKIENLGIVKPREYIYKNENYFNTIDKRTLAEYWRRA